MRLTLFLLHLLLLSLSDFIIVILKGKNLHCFAFNVAALRCLLNSFAVLFGVFFFFPVLLIPPLTSFITFNYAIYVFIYTRNKSYDNGSAQGYISKGRR